MRTSALVLLPLLVLAASFKSMYLYGSVHGLCFALDCRIAELEGLPEPTPDDRKEAAGLRKARATLDDWQSGETSADVRPVCSALGAASGASTDARVAFWAGEVLASFDTLGHAAKAGAENGRDLLADAGNRAKVQKAIDKSSPLLLGAGGIEDWRKAAKVYAKALAGFEKALATALKLRVKEAMAVEGIRCSWTGEDFDADGTADPSPDGRFLFFGGTSPASTPPAVRINMGLRIDEMDGPGTWDLGHMDSIRVYDEDWHLLDLFAVTSGQATVTLLTDRWAAGTFWFTAHSTTSGDISVADGEFSLPVKDE